MKFSTNDILCRAGCGWTSCSRFTAGFVKEGSAKREASAQMPACYAFCVGSCGLYRKACQRPDTKADTSHAASVWTRGLRSFFFAPPSSEGSHSKGAFHFSRIMLLS